MSWLIPWGHASSAAASPLLNFTGPSADQPPAPFSYANRPHPTDSEFTDTLVRVLGKRPEHTHIVIQEIADEDWGFAGMLTDDYRKQRTG